MKPRPISHECAVALLASCTACGGLLTSEPASVSPEEDAGTSTPAPADAQASRDGTSGSGPGGADGSRPGDGDGSTSDGAITDAVVDDGGLPSTAACLTGGNRLVLEGAPGCFWFTGAQTVDGSGTWATEAENYSAYYDGALIQATQSTNPGPSTDPRWSFNFNTWRTQKAMQTGIVYDALAVNGGDVMVGYVQSCSVTLGTFRVDEFMATGGEGGLIGTLLSFTAAFSFTCDGSPGALRGCVHFAR